MLALAAVVHDAASIALLIIGGWWALVGVFALIQGRSTAREVRLEQGVVTFVLASKNVVVPATEIEEFRRSRGDLSHFMPIRVRTAHDGVVKVALDCADYFNFSLNSVASIRWLRSGNPFESGVRLSQTGSTALPPTELRFQKALTVSTVSAFIPDRAFLVGLPPMGN